MQDVDQAMALKKEREKQKRERERWWALLSCPETRLSAER